VEKGVSFALVSLLGGRVLYLLFHEASNLLAGGYETLNLFLDDLVKVLYRPGQRLDWWRRSFYESSDGGGQFAWRRTRIGDSSNCVRMRGVNRSCHIL
jgi:hypothetical protein